MSGIHTWQVTIAESYEWEWSLCNLPAVGPVPIYTDNAVEVMVINNGTGVGANVRFTLQYQQQLPSVGPWTTVPGCVSNSTPSPPGLPVGWQTYFRFETVPGSHIIPLDNVDSHNWGYSIPGGSTVYGYKLRVLLEIQVLGGPWTPPPGDLAYCPDTAGRSIYARGKIGELGVGSIYFSGPWDPGSNQTICDVDIDNTGNYAGLINYKCVGDPFGAQTPVANGTINVNSWSSSPKVITTNVPSQAGPYTYGIKVWGDEGEPSGWTLWTPPKANGNNNIIILGLFLAGFIGIPAYYMLKK